MSYQVRIQTDLQPDTTKWMVFSKIVNNSGVGKNEEHLKDEKGGGNSSETDCDALHY